MALFNHPGIVQVYDQGAYQGRVYLVMEFVSGGTLDQRLRQGPQPFVPAAQLLHQVASSVALLHRLGVVHRDLKPSNILLAPPLTQPAPDGGAESLYGLPKITDLGLARFLDDDQPQEGGPVTIGDVFTSMEGAIVGTPTFMAPEQAMGKKEIGPAADVWSLGIILYQMLTGQVPFRADTPLETLLCIVNAESVPPPSQVRPDVPRGLETICLRCLSPEAQKRFANGQELADALGEWLAQGNTSWWRSLLFWRRR
jgi:serine/threonine protein kinase